MNEPKKNILGATTKVEQSRERAFKRELKKFFPEASTISFVYSDLGTPKQVSQKIKDEGCFGYNKKESILMDGKSIKIAWLPHVKDMSASHIELIIERIVEANDSRVATDSSSLSVG